TVSSPSITAELVADVLKAAAPVLRRAVVLSVRGHSIHGVAQVGLEDGEQPPSQRVRAVRLPLNEESVLALAAVTGHLYQGSLRKNRWNEAFQRQLGGDWPLDVVVAPIRVAGVIRLLLYGDNFPNPGPIRAIGQLQENIERLEETESVASELDAEGLTLT
ncbi:MAG: hypothetical protein GY906_26360, partial [bacterium]|nr:hypothetical protein [bacterium]